MANPNPSKKWPKGTSGNPGGFTSELKAKHARAAEIAADIRLSLLTQFSTLPPEQQLKLLTGEIVSTVKQADDRHNGQPTQPIEATVHGDIAYTPQTPEEWAKKHGAE